MSFTAAVASKYQDSDIKQLPEIELNGSGLDDLTGLKDCVELKVLRLEKNMLITSATLTANLPPQLEQLYLSGTGVENSEFLKSVQNLEYLDVNNTPIAELANIPPKLKTLKALNTKLSGLDFVKSFNNGIANYLAVSLTGEIPWGKLDFVTTLHVKGNYVKVDGFSKSCKIQCLMLESNSINSIKSLCKLQSLLELHLINSKDAKIEEIIDSQVQKLVLIGDVQYNMNGLDKLTKITDLELNMKFRDLELPALDQLTRLVLQGQAEQPIIGSSLSGERLTELIVETKIQNFHFDNMRNLEKLILDNCMESINVNELGQMFKLQQLLIRSVKLQTVEGLETCASLQVLELNNVGDLDDLSQLEDLPTLQQLFVKNNKQLESFYPSTSFKTLVLYNDQVFDRDALILDARQRKRWNMQFMAHNQLRNENEIQYLESVDVTKMKMKDQNVIAPAYKAKIMKIDGDIAFNHMDEFEILQDLEIVNCSLQNLQCISKNRCIEHLVIRNCPNLKDISAIISLKLKYLEFWNNPIIEYTNDVFKVIGPSLNELIIDGITEKNQSVLPLCTGVRSLTLKTELLDNLDIMQSIAKNIKYFMLYAPMFTNPGIFYQMTEIDALHIPDSGIVDFEFIVDLSTLKKFSCSALQTDLKPFGSCEHIEELTILTLSTCDFSRLSQLQSLTKLGISIQLSDEITEENPLPKLALGYLTEFTNLLSLTLANCDIGNCIDKLQFLSELNLNNVKLDSIDILRVFVNLKSLSLRNINLGDNIQFLKMINRIQSLDIQFCNISESIYCCMDEMKKLSFVNLSNNEIRYVSLTDFPELKELLLTNNQIDKVSLSQFPLLQKLDLSHNRLNMERQLTFEEQLSMLQQTQGSEVEKGIQKFIFVLNCPLLKELYFEDNNFDDEVIKLQVVRIGIQILQFHFQVTEKMYEQADAQEFVVHIDDKPLKYVNLFNVGQDKDTKVITPTKFDKVKYGAIDGQQTNIMQNAMCLIAGSSNFNELRELNMKGFGLIDISVLDKCFGLKDLDLSDNPGIKNFAVLKQLLNVERIILDNTNVQSLNFAKPMSRLSTLSAENCPNLTTLAILNSCKNLKDLHVFGSPIIVASLPTGLSITSLSISGVTIQNFDFVSSDRTFQMLTALKIDLVDYENLDVMKNLGGLLSLELRSKSLTSVLGLNKLKGLTTLKLFCEKATDIEQAIKQTPSIQDLSINDYILKECNFLNPLVKLDHLSVTIDQATNINAIARMTKLVSIYLYCCNAQVKFEVFQKLTQIKEFKVESVQNTNFQFVANFRTLEKLMIKSCPEIQDLKFLQTLVCITECHFENTSLPEMDGIAHLISCQSLTLRKCGLSHIDPIKKIRNKLTKLDISNNSITSLTALEGQSVLQYLYASNNEISRVDPLLAIKELLHVDLEGNLIRGSINDYIEEEYLFLTELFILVHHEKLISVNFEQNGLTGSPATRYAILRLLPRLAFITTGSENTSQRQVSYIDTKLAEQIEFYIKKGKDIIQYGYEMKPERFAMLQMDDSKQANVIDKCDRGAIALPYKERMLNYLLRKYGKATCSEVDDLDLSNTHFQSYDFISEFHNLRFLKLSCVDLPDYDFLTQFDQIEILHLSGTRISDIQFLTKFSRLRELYINNTQIKSINQLASMKTLRTLNVMGLQLDPSTFKPFPQLDTLFIDCFDKRNGEFIKMFNNITELTIIYNESNTDFVQALTKLNKLFISSKELKSIQQITKIKTITSLTLNCPALTDLPQVKQIPELKTLVVTQPLLRELLFVRDIKSLERLDVSLRETMDVEVLSQLDKLRQLKLNCSSKNANLNIDQFAIPDKLNYLVDLQIRNLKIMDPKKLSVFRHLETLVLENNDQDFLDIDFIKSLAKLKVLKISGSQLQDLHAFQTCNNIEDLTLENVGLPECNEVAQNQNLTSLNLAGNNLINIQSLGKISGLKKLILNDNRLNDDCMQYICQLKHLSYLNISSNQLGGVMESAEERNGGVITIAQMDCLVNIKFLDMLEHLDVSNNKICDAENYQEKILRINPSIVFLNQLMLPEMILDKAENLDFKLYDYPHRDCYHFKPNFDVKQKISEQIFEQKLKRARAQKLQERIDHPIVVYPTYNELKFLQKKEQLQQLAQILSPIGAMKTETTLFTEIEYKPHDVIDEEEDTIIYGDFENLMLLITGQKSLNDITVINLSGFGLTLLDKVVQCQNLVEINLSGNDIQDIGPLTQLSKLQSIDLSDNKRLSTIGDFQKFKPGQLKRLIINRTPVHVTLQDAQSFNKIKQLEVVDCMNFDIKLLKEFKDLELLRISRLNDDILQDIFKPLSQLMELEIISEIQNFQFLLFLSKLQKFSLNSSVVGEIQFNPNLEATQKSALKTIEINCDSATKIEFKQSQINTAIIRNAALSTLSFINNYKNLEYLLISPRIVMELEVLTSLKQLIHLEIDGRKLSTANQNQKFSLNQISKSQSIRELIVSHCPLEDISSVFSTGLKQIEILHLTQNRIQLTNTKFLKDCTKLRQLTISNLGSVGISDITTLQHLNVLEDLNLANNQLVKFDVLSNSPNLKFLDISNNKELQDFQAFSFDILPSVEVLILNQLKQLIDFVPLEKLSNLKELHINGCMSLQPETGDLNFFKPLMKCNQLQKIYFLDTALLEIPNVKHVLMRLFPNILVINEAVNENDLHIASLLQFQLGNEDDGFVNYDPTFVEENHEDLEQGVTEKATVYVQLNPWQVESGKYEKLSVLPKIKPWQPNRTNLHLFKKDGQ